MQKRYEIFADYHQFYLWDHGEMPDTALDYSEDDLRRRVKTAPFLLVIQPERNMSVPVELDIVDAPPDEALDLWDHVVEASLDLPSGRLEIHECTGGSIDILSVAPGTYRVRVCFGGLTTLTDDRLDGEDHYRLILWPAPSAPLAVIKHYADPRL
ncbi:hypothetical protein [Methylobacterium bullatum]|uniref:Uncharacterized protein n=1 Tax=Methylobacterium bullatum TaxID=570505 RepID=A0A679JRL6_9HYPH|nr:hypothetical protein MBLL_00626 [Methylobacterium bullatum]